MKPPSRVTKSTVHKYRLEKNAVYQETWSILIWLTRLVANPAFAQLCTISRRVQLNLKIFYECYHNYLSTLLSEDELPILFLSRWSKVFIKLNQLQQRNLLFTFLHNFCYNLVLGCILQFFFVFINEIFNPGLVHLGTNGFTSLPKEELASWEWNSCFFQIFKEDGYWWATVWFPGYSLASPLTVACLTSCR